MSNRVFLPIGVCNLALGLVFAASAVEDPWLGMSALWLFACAYVCLRQVRQREVEPLSCDDCGGEVFVWWAPDRLWNVVMAGPAAKDDPGGILCASCFAARVDNWLRATNPKGHSE